MITNDSVIPKYLPYKKLSICSNDLLGGGHLVSIKGVLPLVIGSGEQPLIWIQVPTDSSGENFTTLVEASISKDPRVNISSQNNELSVTINKTLILNIIKIDTETAIVDKLNLQPIGFNIVGNKEGLKVGGINFQGNTLSGGSTLITLGL